MQQYDMNRRAFLESTAASGLAAAALTGSARAAAAAQNEAIRVGIVDPGGRGIGLLKDGFEHGSCGDRRSSTGSSGRAPFEEVVN